MYERRQETATEQHPNQYVFHVLFLFSSAAANTSLHWLNLLKWEQAQEKVVQPTCCCDLPTPIHKARLPQCTVLF
jgi:hypothetical protein